MAIKYVADLTFKLFIYLAGCFRIKLANIGTKLIWNYFWLFETAICASIIVSKSSLEVLRINIQDLWVK